MDLCFQALVPQFPDIGEPAAREAAGRKLRDPEECVVRNLVVVRKPYGNTVIEERGIKASLDLRGDLRTDVGVTDVRRYEGWDTG